MSSYEANWASVRRVFFDGGSLEGILNRNYGELLHATSECECFAGEWTNTQEKLAAISPLVAEEVVALERIVVLL